LYIYFVNTANLLLYFIVLQIFFERAALLVVTPFTSEFNLCLSSCLQCCHSRGFTNRPMSKH